MQEFKVGDWVRDTRQGMKNPIVQLKSNCIALTNPKEYATQYELWEPKEGEWCWSKYDGLVRVIQKETPTNSYIVEPVALTIQRQLYDITGLEPFIGELPTFLKDK